jgi:hypothetical protein
VPGNEKKCGTRTKQSWPNTIRENQREKAEEKCVARAHRAPYDKIREVEELKVISHPNKGQE